MSLAPLRLPVVRSAMIRFVVLARIAWQKVSSSVAATGGPDLLARIEIAHLRQEIIHLQEEIRIKDARMARIPAANRPRYSSTERMAILELVAARGWSAKKAAKRFLVSRGTLGNWRRRLDDEGASGLLSLGEPVNRFPDYLRYAVRRLKALFPLLGKKKIAAMLCRAGLHIAASTVGRIVKEMPKRPDEPVVDERARTENQPSKKPRIVAAKYPNHVWHVDLTLVPIVGLSIPWGVLHRHPGQRPTGAGSGNRALARTVRRDSRLAVCVVDGSDR